MAEELEKYPIPVYLTLWGWGGEGIGMFWICHTSIESCTA